VRAAFAGLQIAQGDGTVCEIRFRATGEPGSSTELILACPQINNLAGQKLPIQLINGSINIVPEKLRGDCTGEGELDFWDAICALEMSVKKRPEDLIMDMDSSGRVDSRDAVLILQASTGIERR